jgi:desulfoferrodoxin-like iron-binding protein
MKKTGNTYFCEICRQKVVVVEDGFGVLVCCGQEMNLVAKKSMMETWTSAHPKPEGGVIYVCKECGQKIEVVEETTGILECCGQRMQRESDS